MGRPSLGDRVAVRLGPEGILRKHLRSNALGEGVTQLLYRMAQFRLVPHAYGQRLGWILFGWLSRRHLQDQKIFHVRSGAGQGGVIKKARRKGMRILVDHSIAHPAYMQKVLGHEYLMAGKKTPINSADPFWSLVLDDCKEADLLMVNSDFVKETFIKEGFPVEKIEVNYLGVRSDFWGIKTNYSREPVLKLLFTGAFELRKGCRILVEAMECLRSRGVDFELHLAGSDSEAYHIFGDRLAQLPIVRHGSLLQDDLKSLLEECDIYVFPTFAEGCARSAMEAMYAGLPVITTNACGLPGDGGVHWMEIEAGDVQNLVCSIEQLAGDTEARARLGRAGVSMARSGSYTWDSYGRKLIFIYDQLARS